MTDKKPSAKIQEVLDTLRASGARITALRSSLIGLFIGSSRPLTAAEILAELKKKKLAPNKSSVYRELDFLLELGRIIEIDVLEGMKRYEWQPEHAQHHHHIVCTQCGVVECIELCFNEEELSAKVAKKSGFAVTSHVLEFFGVCADCR
ncbi:MAG: transcriptional repressor [Deltaproteobacteria bacterium]|nr:transcriptional repressor [Deltaproteobacteria bacterium]